MKFIIKIYSFTLLFFFKLLKIISKNDFADDLIQDNDTIKRNSKSLIKNHLADIIFDNLDKSSISISDTKLSIIDWDGVDTDFHILELLLVFYQVKHFYHLE